MFSKKRKSKDTPEEENQIINPKNQENEKEPDESDGADGLNTVEDDTQASQETDCTAQSVQLADVDSESAQEDSTILEAIEQAYCLGAGIDSTTLSMAKAKIAEIVEAAASNTFSPDLIHIALRLINFDKLINEAHRAGFEEGRNEKIAEAFRDKRKRAGEAASIPHLNGAGDLKAPLGSSSIFDIARDVR